MTSCEVWSLVGDTLKSNKTRGYFRHHINHDYNYLIELLLYYSILIISNQFEIQIVIDASQ